MESRQSNPFVRQQFFDLNIKIIIKEMSTQVQHMQKEVSQLRQEANVPRIPVSQAIEEYIMIIILCYIYNIKLNMYRLDTVQYSKCIDNFRQ